MNVRLTNDMFQFKGSKSIRDRFREKAGMRAVSIAVRGKDSSLGR